MARAASHKQTLSWMWMS